MVETSPGVWAIRTGQEVYGGIGNDNIMGSAGRDILHGGAGNDTLNGGGGADVIEGGKGNDMLTGGLGSDSFKWSLGDGGTAGAPATDTVTDFSTSTAGGSKDALDLKDLLVGESHTGTAVGNLGNFLHFVTSGGTTTIDVSTTGAFATGDNAAAISAKTDQVIVLQGADLTNGGALTTDAAIIQDLLTKGKLQTD